MSQTAVSGKPANELLWFPDRLEAGRGHANRQPVAPEMPCAAYWDQTTGKNRGSMSTPLNASLLKGFAILNLFSDQRPEITIATVCKELDLNTATAHRFLATLEEAGALLSHERGRYSLGLLMSEYGALAGRISPIVSVVQPVIDALASELGESVLVMRPGENGVICTALAEVKRPISVSIKLGTVLDYHATAHGKLWFAHMKPNELSRRLKALSLRRHSERTIVDIERLKQELEQIRQQGYSLNIGEQEPEIAAQAVPVWTNGGELLVTLSVFGMRHRFDEAFLELSRRRLMDAADEIQKRLYSR